MTGRAILRLIRPPGVIEARRIAFDGIDLLRASERQMRAIRGERIAMVMQDPKFSLNPVMRIGRQLIEALQPAHEGIAARGARGARSTCWRPCRSAIPSASSTPIRTSSPAAWASAS